MSLRDLPNLAVSRPPEVCAFQPSDEAVDRWNGGVSARQDDDNTISMLDVIGDDFWTGGGVTAKRVKAALRSIGDGDVYVDLNSPGGDFFEGCAIYNLLREHRGKVTIRILGLAASAASVIAMAGDEIQIGKSAFIMVHNAWVVAIGDRNDMAAAASALEPFDDAMATVYSDRSGTKKAKVAEWMDVETWFNGEQAIDAGLADDYLPSNMVTEDKEKARAMADIKPVLKAEHGLQRAGMKRQERRSLLGEIMKSSAVATTKRQAVAGEETLAGLNRLITTLGS